MSNIIENSVLERLRAIRLQENMVMIPSPYLRDSFINEYGEGKTVTLRNYQKQMVMNLLQMEKFCQCDDTGLGKSLETLSAIGYIWLLEPDYIPIVVVTKSALFQWEAETKKFMQGMEAIPVSGDPQERHKIYEDFFGNHNSSKKRILLVTYDTLLRDLDESVIRDRELKVSSVLKKELVEKRKESKILEESFDSIRSNFDAYFGERIFDVISFVGKVVSSGRTEKDPPTWCPLDEKNLQVYLEAREGYRAVQKRVDELSYEVAPALHVPGILKHVQQLQARSPNTKFMLVMDEVHKLKNHKSQIHQKVFGLRAYCKRVIGMTATPVKNRLMEFFAIFHIIEPALFPKVTHFQNEYCITKMQKIGGGRQVPVVVGYKNLDKFVQVIEPYYLSRKKHDVAKELPELISTEVECELHDMQEQLYDMAEAGLMQDLDDPDANGGDMLSALTMVQQAVNAPQLILNEEDVPFEGPSSKIDALLELLQEGAEGQKVIVYSKFEKFISLVEKALNEAQYEDESGKKRTGIKCVRVTGKESDPKLRLKAMNMFQDVNSGVNVILITNAGSESINLQSAQHFVFLDMPWSIGDYFQLIGRMIRIGSSHVTVVAHHFLGRKRDGKKTVDHDILRALREKKKLADKVAGDNLQSAFDFSQNVADDIFESLRRNGPQTVGAKGTLLQKANEKIRAAQAKGEKEEKKMLLGITPKIGKPKKLAKIPLKEIQKDEVPTFSVDLDLDSL